MIARPPITALVSRRTLLALAVAAACVAGCNQDKKEAAPAAAADPNLVTATAVLQQQIKVEAAETAAVSETMRVAGRVDFDEQRVARIGAPVTGRVVELLANPGESVAQGQPLAQIHSTELSNAQLAYLKARAQARLAAQNAERARQLFAADVIGAAELQRRESEYAIAQAEERAGADQLRVLGLSTKTVEQMSQSGGINSVSPVAATLSGVVVERKVAKGQVVQPADALYTVADLSRVWVIAQVPESESAAVKLGQQVQIEVPALADGPLTGKLIYVSDIVNPETRTVTVRTELENGKRHLKPAMLATMLIEARPQQRLVLPSSAVVREDNADYVFVATETANQFRLTRVKLGAAQKGAVVVQSGVNVGDKVVIDGAFHLNNERKRKELEGGA